MEKKQRAREKCLRPGKKIQRREGPTRGGGINKKVVASMLRGAGYIENRIQYASLLWGTED